MSLQYLILLTCIGAVYSQSEPSIDDALNSLPPELQGKIDESQIKEIQNKSTQAFRELCNKNGGPDAYPAAENAFEEFTKCLRELVNVNLLQKEIEDSKPNGEVDEVFKKYCAKTPSFKACFRNMTESIHPCFTPEEQTNLKTVHNISEQLAEFICFKEGDRIALFIAEHGPECLQEKQDAIQQCVNETMGARLQVDQTNFSNFSVDSIPKLKFGEEECNKFSELQTCVVSALDTCSEPTSSNIIESLFKFIRKATPCKEIPAKGAPSVKKQSNEKVNAPFNSASSLAIKTTTMGAIALVLLM